MYKQLSVLIVGAWFACFLFITRNIYQTSYMEMFFATFKNTVIIFKLFLLV